MPLDLTNTSPLDSSETAVASALSNLQGNILKGHGRDFAAYLFFSFGKNISATKASLRELASTFVISTQQQLAETALFQSKGIPGDLFGNLFLTASGYRQLGFDVDTMFPEADDPIGSTKSSFAAGLKATAVSDLNDPDPSTWEAGFQQPIDGMLLLAHDDTSALSGAVATASAALTVANTLIFIENGNVLRENGNGIEHFGYVDGRSQPLYLKTDFVLDSTGKRVGDKDGSAIDVWDPLEPLWRVLIQDPGVSTDPDCYGSYFVFRKLEQDVKGFKDTPKQGETGLADALTLAGDDRERAGAMVIGRFENGSPVTQKADDSFLPVRDNNFTYAGDAAGLKCPFHSHIRKTNPRGDIERIFGAPAEAERSRRITRRAMPYGTRFVKEETSPPTGGRGLLFQCFQASIRQQFAFMQHGWANTESFVKAGTGIDPVIGQGVPPIIPQQWPKGDGSPSLTTFPFSGFVSMKGGEFFFAPSIPFFSTL